MLTFEETKCFIAIFRSFINNSNTSNLNVRLWRGRRVSRLGVTNNLFLGNTHVCELLADNQTTQPSRRFEFFVFLPLPSYTPLPLDPLPTSSARLPITTFSSTLPYHNPCPDEPTPDLSPHRRCTRRQLPSVTSQDQGFRVQSTLLTGARNGVDGGEGR
jgi:hypothetical protein